LNGNCSGAWTNLRRTGIAGLADTTTPPPPVGDESERVALSLFGLADDSLQRWYCDWLMGRV